MSISYARSIPLNIRKELYDYNIPLRVSDRIFNEMKNQGVQGNYKKVQVLPTDHEWRFVWKYFHHDKPNKYGIKRIYCINKIQQQQAFELNLSSIEREAKTFQPTWNQESRVTQRAQAIELWKQTADVFSPFANIKSNERENFEYVKIMPLWHIRSKSVCNSESETGFIYFGKTSESQNKDFSENGIYFTNSARYATDIYNEKDLFLAWVSMKEPFPIIGDSKTDIENFQEKYKDYNAYYVPVTSINHSDKDVSTCYSSKGKPRCDEFVVFHKSQTLPYFWIEIEVELPYIPSDTPEHVNELIPHFMKLLQNHNVDRYKKLRNYLCRELGILLTCKEDDCLEERHKTMYEQLKQILDSQGKVNRQLSRALLGTSQATFTAQSTQQTESTTNTSENLVFLQSFPPNHSMSFPSMPKAQAEVYPCIPDIAFGKAEWEKYFGDIGVEPPLPKNIEEILNEPCSFWPDRKVRETHLLVLIPNEVNGKTFTLNYLGELIQKPKSGHSTKYRVYSDYVKKTVGEKSYPSHWVLMARDIIHDSRFVGYLECCELIANHSKKAGLPYELPNLLEATASILMHYVRTGERLYNDNPWTFTFSQDVNKANYPMGVGGFDPNGIYVRYCGISHLGVAGCWKF